MNMPFGKHKGEDLSDIPSAYLQWVLGRNIYEWLRVAIASELSSRDGGAKQSPPKREHPGVVSWRENWRSIIFLAHPDRGGDERLCKLLVAVNEAMNDTP